MHIWGKVDSPANTALPLHTACFRSSGLLTLTLPGSRGLTSVAISLWRRSPSPGNNVLPPVKIKAALSTVQQYCELPVSFRVLRSHPVLCSMSAKILIYAKTDLSQITFSRRPSRLTVNKPGGKNGHMKSWGRGFRAAVLPRGFPLVTRKMDYS